MDMFDRTRRLLGQDALDALEDARVIVFGLGGVGGSLAEALVRSGVGALTLVDADCVEISNLNRQIIATRQTIGMPKAQAMRERALSIRPDARVRAVQAFYGPENAADFDLGGYDYVADAIDTVASKLLLIESAVRAGAPIISAMGAGNKLDPSQFCVEDLSRTRACPLARVMRRELKRRGIEHLKVVYSPEPPCRATDGERAPASVAFVPPAAGLVMAGAIVRDLIARRP